MATVPDGAYAVFGQKNRLWSAVLEGFDEHARWLLVAAYAGTIGLLFVVAASVAMVVGSILPGVAGGIAFVALGVTLVAASPTTARGIFERVLQIHEGDGGGPPEEPDRRDTRRPGMHGWLWNGSDGP